MKTKSASDSTRAFKRMIHKQQPQKIWSDKGTEFKGEFKTKHFVTQKELKLTIPIVKQNPRLPKGIFEL